MDWVDAEGIRWRSCKQCAQRRCDICFRYSMSCQAGSSGVLAQSFGSMFTYNNEVYAAANNGDGMFRINLDGFDFDSPSKPAAVFEFVGQSMPTSGNDGMNCLQATDPYDPECPLNSSPEFPLRFFNASDCQCNGGYTGVPRGLSRARADCLACEPGKYKNTPGSAACASCTSGKTSWPERGGKKCVCVTPTPFFICGCHELVWRETR